jgi:hypothetical protein
LTAIATASDFFTDEISPKGEILGIFFLKIHFLSQNIKINSPDLHGKTLICRQNYQKR